jgi:hypothetical protein
MYCFISSGNEPDFILFYILRLKLDDAKPEGHTLLLNSINLAGNDWRPGLFT